MIIRILLLMLVSWLGPADLCHAQDKKVDKDAARRVQQKLRQLEQEKTQLIRDKEQLALEKGELVKEKNAAELALNNLRVQFDGTRRRLNEESAKVGALTKDVEGVNAGRRSLMDKLAEVERQFEDAKAKLKLADRERVRLEEAGSKLREMVAQQTQNIDLCENNNKKLYQYGTELMERYQRKTCRDALLQAEPITGLKRVEIEGLMEAYSNKLRDQRFPR